MDILSKIGGSKKKKERLTSSEYELLAEKKYLSVLREEQETELRHIAVNLDSLGSDHYDYDLKLQNLEIKLQRLNDKQYELFNKNVLNIKDLQQNYIQQLSYIVDTLQKHLNNTKDVDQENSSDLVHRIIQCIENDLDNNTPQVPSTDEDILDQFYSQWLEFKKNIDSKQIHQKTSDPSPIPNTNTSYNTADIDAVQLEELFRTMEFLKRENFELKMRIQDVINRNKLMRTKAKKYIKLLEDLISTQKKGTKSCDADIIWNIWHHLNTKDNKHNKKKCIICQTFDLTDIALLP